MCVRVCVCIPVCVYVCMCVYIYIYLIITIACAPFKSPRQDSSQEIGLWKDLFWVLLAGISSKESVDQKSRSHILRLRNLLSGRWYFFLTFFKSIFSKKVEVTSSANEIRCLDAVIFFNFFSKYFPLASSSFFFVSWRVECWARCVGRERSKSASYIFIYIYVCMQNLHLHNGYLREIQ